MACDLISITVPTYSCPHASCIVCVLTFLILRHVHCTLYSCSLCLSSSITACSLLDLLISMPTSAYPLYHCLCRPAHTCVHLCLSAVSLLVPTYSYLCPPLPVLLLTASSSPVSTNIFALLFLSSLLVFLSWIDNSCAHLLTACFFVHLLICVPTSACPPTDCLFSCSPANLWAHLCLSTYSLLASWSWPADSCTHHCLST